MEYIIEHIRAMRAAHKKTQHYMAELLGVQQSTYSRIENGKEELKLSYLKIIAKEFNIEPHELLERAKEPVLPHKEKK